MTEPGIRDLLAFAEAEREAAPLLSAELIELAELARQIGAIALHVRLTTIATQQATKCALLDRLVPRAEAEDTQPIIISRESEICSRCHGTGEVPAL